MHLVVLPLALVQATVGPDIPTATLDPILLDLTIVAGAISPLELSIPMLHALTISPLISLISSLLLAESLLHILIP